MSRQSPSCRLLAPQSNGPQTATIIKVSCDGGRNSDGYCNIQRWPKGIQDMVQGLWRSQTPQSSACGHNSRWPRANSSLSVVRSYLINQPVFVNAEYILTVADLSKNYTNRLGKLCLLPIQFSPQLLGSIPIVLYDQIGSGASSHFRDAPDTFWHPYLFLDQLDNLVEHLDIHRNFDLLGHSWGGNFRDDNLKISLSH